MPRCLPSNGSTRMVAAPSTHAHPQVANCHRERRGTATPTAPPQTAPGRATSAHTHPEPAAQLPARMPLRGIDALQNRRTATSTKPSTSPTWRRKPKAESRRAPTASGRCIDTATASAASSARRLPSQSSRRPPPANALSRARCPSTCSFSFWRASASTPASVGAVSQVDTRPSQLAVTSVNLMRHVKQAPHCWSSRSIRTPTNTQALARVAVLYQGPQVPAQCELSHVPVLLAIRAMPTLSCRYQAPIVRQAGRPRGVCTASCHVPHIPGLM